MRRVSCVSSFFLVLNQISIDLMLAEVREREGLFDSFPSLQRGFEMTATQLETGACPGDDQSRWTIGLRTRVVHKG